MNLFSALMELPLRVAADIRSRRFLANKPLDAQRELLPGLLGKAASTRFGIYHNFAEIASLPFDSCYQKFQEQVPIRNYSQFWNDWFAPHIKTSHHCQELLLDNLTWPGQIPYFCETSGTTAPSKFIPFTDEMFRMNRMAALDMISCYLSAKLDSRLPGSKILYMAGSTGLKEMGPGVLAGDMSAITLKNRPKWLDSFVEPKEPLASMQWEERLSGMARLLIEDSRIRVISGVPPWILLLLQKVEEISGEGVDNILPGLELIIHGGTSITPYRNEFKNLFSAKRPGFLELLPSSEAFMGFQVWGETAMRLTPFYGVFYEFVPVDQLDETGVPVTGASAVPLADVQVGQRYAVILSTCSGLWRYHIGDTLRFLDNETFHIEFTGRDKFLDRFEEKVTQSEVENAVAMFNDLNGGVVREFMAGADIKNRCHQWVLACRGNGMSADMVSDFLDTHLRDSNADYNMFRCQGRIKAPGVLMVDEQLIYDWSLEVRGKLGGQSKIPHIDPTLTGELVKSLKAFSIDYRQHSGH